MGDDNALKKSPLNAVHRELGARMVDFGGWDMPVQYAGVIDEHRATRTAAGLFDVSHMGELEVKGARALDLIQSLTPNDASRLAPGQIQYSALTTEQGTFVDDILVYCRGAEDYLLVVNASNCDKDYEWVALRAGDDVEVKNVSAAIVQIAVQGPASESILQPLVPTLSLDQLSYYKFEIASVADRPDCIVSRTGYTGEDGFEMYIGAEHGEHLWRRLLDEGHSAGLRPCGLGARDTLRLEAKLPLYGNDIDDTTTVVEADLGWIVKLNKGEFLGRDVLVREKDQGAARRLVGFEMVDRGIARHGYPVRVGGKPSGTVTSGSFAPHAEKNIGLAYLPTESSAPGTELEVEIRGRSVAARVVPTPFVPHRTKRSKKA